MRRRIFGGSPPEWFRDAAGLLGNFSLLNCIPTIAAILLVPRHFFRRLNEAGRRTLPLSVSPIKLVLNCATLATLGLVFVGLQPQKDIVLSVALAIAILSPIWMTAVICFTAIAASFGRAVSVRQIGRIGLFNFLFYRLIGYVLPLAIAVRSLETLSLFKLNNKKAIWGCAYLSMVLFLYELIILGTAIGLMVGLGYVSQSNENGGDPLAQLFAVAILIFLAVSVEPFVSCFGAMVSSVSVYPCRRYYKYRALQLRRISTDFFAGGEDKQSECRQKMLQILWLSVSETLLAERRVSVDEALTLRFLRGRVEGLSAVDSLDIFFDISYELRLSKCFCALKEPTLLGGNDLVPMDIFANRALWVSEDPYGLSSLF